MSTMSATSSLETGRLRSVDVFRGATVVAMILVNAEYASSESYRQLVHAAWHGWTFADTIFPCFLFIVGVSLTLSVSSRVSRGQSESHLLAHAALRALLIFACGVAVDYLRFPTRDFPFVGLQDHLQLSGVLQKIAVCYLFAFLILLWAGLRGAIVGIVILNLTYLALLYFYPVPGCGAGSLVETCNFPGYIDDLVLGGFRWNHASFDPDGVGAIFPAISSVLFGALAGHLLLRQERRPHRRVLPFLFGGLVLIAAGELLSIWVPINKQLWTTSFAVLTAGLAMTALGCVIWLVDGRPLPRWLRPLEVLGLNALAAYVISRLIQHVPRVHVRGTSLYTDALSHLLNPPNASLVFAMIVVAAVFLAVWLMDRLGWHLKF